MLISVSVTRSLKDRLDWIQDVLQGKDTALSSCYASSIDYYKENPSPNLRFALLSALKSGYPTHMIVLGKRNEIVHDSLEHKRVSKSFSTKILYKPFNVVETCRPVHIGKFKELENQ